MTPGEHCSRRDERAGAPRDCATSTGLLYPQRLLRAVLFPKEGKKRGREYFHSPVQSVRDHAG